MLESGNALFTEAPEKERKGFISCSQWQLTQTHCWHFWWNSGSGCNLRGKKGWSCWQTTARFKRWCLGGVFWYLSTQSLRRPSGSSNCIYVKLYLWSVRFAFALCVVAHDCDSRRKVSWLRWGASYGWFRAQARFKSCVHAYETFTYISRTKMFFLRNKRRRDQLTVD